MIGWSGSPSRKLDDHFLADARDVDPAPVLAGPELRDAHPARALFVLLAIAVPVKLHLHAAVLVGVDLLSRFADDSKDGLEA